MEVRLDGQAAIVTGAGAGIGRATALLLAERGARVLVNDADAGRAEAVAAEIRSGGGEAIGEGSAGGSRDAARRIVERALASFGRLDILVNNAGISRPAPFGADSDEDIDLVLDVNLRGPYALMRAAWPAMREQKYGRILNTASSAALGSGISGAYAPTKAGIIGLTKEAAQSGRAFGIKVNAILPPAHTELLDKHPDPDFRAWMRDNFDPGRAPPRACSWSRARAKRRRSCSLSAAAISAGWSSSRAAAFSIAR
jgi:NAD(P)-dependent dehydrogenase (short-subunit alcohol dehydrogenase family)